MYLLCKDELYHHGIKGQKWGLRRFQNEDGTLTEAGRKRYLQEAKNDMDADFKRRLSNPEARKVFRINKNGTVSTGMDAGDAYRKGKISNRDYDEARKAAREAHKYAQSKYGEDAMKELAKTGSFTVSKKGIQFYKVKDFEPKALQNGKKMTTLILENNLNNHYKDSVTKAEDRNREQPWSEKPSKWPTGGRI